MRYSINYRTASSAVCGNLIPPLAGFIFCFHSSPRQAAGYSGQKIKSKTWELKEKAQKLRKTGKSYSEIMNEIPVAQSTLSGWCKGIFLTADQRRRLVTKKGDSIPGITAIQKIYWAKQKDAFTYGMDIYANFRKNPAFIGGLMLYMAEGRKTNGACVTNSDARVISLMVKWFENFFSIPPTKLSVYPHIHSGQDEGEIRNYWSNLTKIPMINFRRSFTKPEGSGHKKNILYRGTVAVRVIGTGSTYLLYTIFGAIASYFKETLRKEISIKDWIKKPSYA